MTGSELFDVGGVQLERPFKIRRLGHFGVNVVDSRRVVDFYTRELGFRVSDAIDFGAMVTGPGAADQADGVGYFLRHATDHHSYVVFPKEAFEAATAPNPPGVTANQLTWQVGSLEEVRAATDWFPSLELPVVRAGRDMPGSNWHVYLPDPDGHVNELYYGIEQIGWNGYTKPPAMYERIFHTAPDLPQMSEADEVSTAFANGTSVTDGYRHVEDEPSTFAVQGILLPRPFKVTRIGPISLFVADLDASVAFYTSVLGLTVTERTSFRGRECVYLRANTEHHSLALWPIELRDELRLSDHTTLGPIGLQVANYRQLRDGASFLGNRGWKVDQLDPSLHPGIDYSFCVRDPDGHTLQLYYYMEQIGWDGVTRPRSQGPLREVAQWPETVPAQADTFSGEAFLGPWG